MKLLFVCTGNTCRSAMANVLYAGESDSAGLFAFDGQPAARNAVIAVGKRGGDLSRHRAKSLDLRLVEEADVIVCMTEEHASFVLDKFPGKQVVTLNIEDPYGDSYEIYEKCADRITAALKSHGYQTI